MEKDLKEIIKLVEKFNVNYSCTIDFVIYPPRYLQHVLKVNDDSEPVVIKDFPKE